MIAKLLQEGSRRSTIPNPTLSSHRYDRFLRCFLDVNSVTSMYNAILSDTTSRSFMSGLGPLLIRSSHMDILYRPEFDTGYEAFWRETADVTKISQIDLRQFALMLIVIAFGVLLDHNPNAFDERRQFVEDLRLIGHEASRVSAMMEDLAANNLGLQDREELSLCWAWAAKKALSEASGFYGESIDTVKAGAMVSPGSTFKS